MNLNKKNLKNYIIDKLEKGLTTEIKVYGSSMLPTIASGEIVKIKKDVNYQIGDIAIATDANKSYFVVHRVIEIKDNMICLCGDNQISSEKEWFDLKDIHGKVIEKKNELKMEDSNYIVINLPFSKPNSFDTIPYEIYQSIKAENSKTFYFDYNIDFNLSIYDKNKIDWYCNSKSFDENDMKIFLRHLELSRVLKKMKYKLDRFSFSNLSLCNRYSQLEIFNTLKEYKKSIYYPFYMDKVNKLKEFSNNMKVYLYVNDFDKLISSIIFSIILEKELNIKPILVDDSPLFNHKYNTSFVNKYFQEIIPIHLIKRNINKSLTTYENINLDKYICRNKIATLRFSDECYYKKCLFCDRHRKDNFYFSVDNVVAKITHLIDKGIDNFIFGDDCLMIPVMKLFCQEIINNDLKIKWKGTFRFEENLNDDSLFLLLKKSGCKMLFLGAESFSQEYLNLVNKNIKVENIINILKLCKKYDIKTSVSFMFNFPGEKVSDLIATEKYIKENINYINMDEFNFFTPTKNYKLDSLDEGINYFYENQPIEIDRLQIINRIIDFVKKSEKLSPFYLKNIEIWK